MDAINILRQAITAISRFYKKNNIKVSLVQKLEGPEYTLDTDTPPTLTWGSNNYRSSESGSIVAILSMLVTDIENAIKEAKNDEKVAQAEYEQDSSSLGATQRAQQRSIVRKEKQLADLREDAADLDSDK